MHPFGATRPPRLALGLGLAGLIPFVSGALSLWVTPEAWRDRVLEELLAYAAITLAFMGDCTARKGSYRIVASS